MAAENTTLPSLELIFFFIIIFLLLLLTYQKKKKILKSLHGNNISQ